MRLKVSKRLLDLHAPGVEFDDASRRERIERCRDREQPRFLRARRHLFGVTAPGAPPVASVLMPPVAPPSRQHQPTADGIALRELCPPQRATPCARRREEPSTGNPSRFPRETEPGGAPHPPDPAPAKRFDHPKPRHPEPRIRHQDRACVMGQQCLQSPKELCFNLGAALTHLRVNLFVERQRPASWSSARWGEDTEGGFARSGGRGFGGFYRNTILSGTKLGALQRARRAEARDGFGQKSPRVVAPAHPCARDIRTSMCSTGQRGPPAISF